MVRNITIPLAPVAGLAAGLAGGDSSPLHYVTTGNLQGFTESLCERYLGWHPRFGFHVNFIKKGFVPLVLGLLVHKVVGGTLGVNRALGRAGVPFIRI